MIGGPNAENGDQKRAEPCGIPIPVFRFLFSGVTRRIVFLVQRLVASARAGSFLGRFRRGARFSAVPVEQDGVLLLMPKEPSLAFYWVPLAIVFTTGGAVLGALS